MISRLHLAIGCFALSAITSLGAPINDEWVPGNPSFPTQLGKPSQLGTNACEGFNAQIIAGRLKVILPGHAESASVEYWHSTDHPGHWRSRDWNTERAEFRGGRWEANLPVDNVDVPLVYFARITTKGSTNVSPMRVCVPARIGMDEPTRGYWGFLDGFEQGMANWSSLDDSPSSHRTLSSTDAKSGKASLSLTIPEKKRSASVGTTRVRTWHLRQSSAYGIKLWLKTVNGPGKVRFSLLSNAFTDQQQTSIFPLDTELTTEWKSVELPFNRFSDGNLKEIDYFAIEFIAQGPAELLIDDLELLGPWNFTLRRAP